jgi:hypothetical protein
VNAAADDDAAFADGSKCLWNQFTGRREDDSGVEFLRRLLV